MEGLRDDIVNSILRSPERSASPLRPSSRSVHFAPPEDLQSILTRYAGGEISLHDELEGLTTHVHNLRGPALESWLKDLQKNMPVLGKKLEDFVASILRISWASQEPSAVEAFKNFVVDLLSAHGFYTRRVAKMLLTNFSAKNEVEDEEQKRIFRNTHLVIKAVLDISPYSGKKELLFQVSDCLPYVLHPEIKTQTAYAENMLEMSGYMPNDRGEILRVLVERLVQLDVRLPKGRLEDDDDDDEEQFQMDCDDDDDCNKSTVTSLSRIPEDATLTIAKEALSSLMDLCFAYLEKEIAANSDEKNDALFGDLMTVFESHVLPTWATGHVQFLIFYMAGLKPAYYGRFIDRMWKVFTNPNSPSVLRQSAISYVASLIARAKYIGLALTKAVLEKIVNWIHSYIKNSEYCKAGQDFMYTDVKTHGPFYAACQSAFYVFAFRHEEFANDRKTINFLKSLNFNTVVTCHLNPLRVCLPPVVKNFSSISRNYQLAYCDTIIQRNERINLPVVGNLSETGNKAKPLLLDSFFPFDPYSLGGIAGARITPTYRDYTGAVEESESEESEDEEHAISTTPHSTSMTFSYEASPGFKL